MKCEICGERKRDLLLRPIECKCYERFVKLEGEGDEVVRVVPPGDEEKKD